MRSRYNRRSGWRRSVANLSALLLGLLISTVTSRTCWSAEPYQPVSGDPVLEPWRWRLFPELNGLEPRCVVQAEDGALWFGTKDGAIRYDGRHWTSYTSDDGLFGGAVHALCVAQDGSLYAGTSSGIYHFQHENWHHLFPTNESSILFNVNDLLEASDGSVWAGTGWGLVHIVGRQAIVHTVQPFAAAIKAHCPNIAISVVPGEMVYQRPWPNDLGILIAQDVIRALAPGGPAEQAGLKLGDHIISLDGVSPVPQSSLRAIQSDTVHLVVSRTHTDQQLRFDVPLRALEGTAPIFLVGDIYEDRQGCIWVAQLPQGLVRFDPRPNAGQDRNRWRRFSDADGFTCKRFVRIAQDVAGHIWAASTGRHGGAFRFDRNQWEEIPLNSFGNGDARCDLLCDSRGTLWIGGSDLYAYRNGALRTYRSQRLPYHFSQVRLCETDDGALWIVDQTRGAVRLDVSTTQWETFQGLHFQCESPSGRQWFLGGDQQVVSYDGSTWTRYSVEDGLIDQPVAVHVKRDGTVWVVGQHHEKLAVACWNGTLWSSRTILSATSAVNKKAVYEDRDGCLWVGLAIVSSGRLIGGLLRLDGEESELFRNTSPASVPLGIAQTADGTYWIATADRVASFDGKRWDKSPEGTPRPASPTSVLHSTQKGELWVGTRSDGLFHYDGRSWQQYTEKDGLSDNRIRSILELSDDKMLVATKNAWSYFDSRSWTPWAIHPKAPLGNLRRSRNGAIWINTRATEQWITVRYQKDTEAPTTTIVEAPDEVRQSDETVVSWAATDPWHVTRDEDIQFAYRLDNGRWSAYSTGQKHVFHSLRRGNHTVAVKARDADFNEEATPASIQFTVVPPVWLQNWFLSLMALIAALILFQSYRLICRTRALAQSNSALKRAHEEVECRIEERTAELAQANEELRAQAVVRKQTEEALRESEERFRQLASVAFEGIAIHDNGRILEVNETFLRIFGYERQEVIGRNVLMLAAPESRDTVKEKVRSGFEDPYEAIGLRKDGSTIPGELIGKTIPYKGAMARVTAVRDITLRKRAEALRDGQNHVLEQLASGASLASVLEMLVHVIEEQTDGMRASVLILDQDGRHLRHGAAPSLPDDYNQFVDGVEIGPSVGSCGTAAFANRRVIVEDIQTDPLWEPFRDIAQQFRLGACWSQPINSVDSGVLGTFAMYYDEPRRPTDAELELIEGAAHVAGIAIERKQAEQALRESEERFRQLAANIDEVFWLITGDLSEVLYVSPAYETIWGRPRQDVYENPRAFLDAVHPDDCPRLEEAIRDHLVGKTTGETVIEYRVVHPDGNERWVQSRHAPVCDENGRVIRLAGTAVDITKHKQIQFEREELITELESKNSELEQFTYTVSHDLKSPLITIEGFLSHLEKDARGGDSDVLAEDIRYITAATSKMNRLLDELLELSRIGCVANAPSEIPLTDLVNETLKSLEILLDEQNVTTDIQPGLPVIVGDCGRLLQVVQNLIENAIKFSIDQPEPIIEIGCRSETGESVIYVKDNGIGIEPEYQERVFGLFDKLDPTTDGTGIGLAIAKRIIEVHGGRIWMESDGLGTGTTACFTLGNIQEYREELAA